MANQLLYLQSLLRRSNANADSDRYSDCYSGTYADANLYSDTNCDRYSNSYTDTNANTDTYSYCNADTDRYAHADSDARSRTCDDGESDTGVNVQWSCGYVSMDGGQRHCLRTNGRQFARRRGHLRIESVDHAFADGNKYPNGWPDGLCQTLFAGQRFLDI